MGAGANPAPPRGSGSAVGTGRVWVSRKRPPGASGDGTRRSRERWVRARGAGGRGGGAGFISPTAQTRGEALAVNLDEAVSPGSAPLAGRPLPRGTWCWGRLRGRLPGGAQGRALGEAGADAAERAPATPVGCDVRPVVGSGACEGCLESPGSGATELPALASALAGRSSAWGAHGWGRLRDPYVPGPLVSRLVEPPSPQSSAGRGGQRGAGSPGHRFVPLPGTSSRGGPGQGRPSAGVWAGQAAEARAQRGAGQGRWWLCSRAARRVPALSAERGSGASGRSGGWKCTSSCWPCGTGWMLWRRGCPPCRSPALPCR